ncbi:MAG TPA: MFS transporter [Candidatus Binatia bacterium]|jgi:putative MFS transporter|nr:MFS transporter [Candidatus Binatia bacterium]
MSTSAPTPHSNLEVSQVNSYLIFLFVLLSTATLFDGFDAAMLTVAAPDARETLHISLSEWGIVFGLARLGVVASFFFLLFADWWGRRTLMMLTIVGFAVFNSLTAFATSKVEFTVYQFFARLFLTAEYSLAIIMIGEEFPARLRGRAIAILTSFATIGVMLIAATHSYVLLGQCVTGSLAEGNCVPPPGNWLHDNGQAVVAWSQRFLGLPVDHADWRILYILGLLPLALVFVLRVGMRETRRFAAEQAPQDQSHRGIAEILRTEYAKAKIPWQPQYRRRTLLVGLLWNCVNLVIAPAVSFWVIYAREQLGFTPSTVGRIIFIGYAGGTAGHFIAGYLVDRIGRKWTCSAFYMFASVAIFMLFQTRTEAEQYLWMILTVFGFTVANTATHVYASELFPTAIRATGYGWTTNLFGRITEVGASFLVAAFINTLGISGSVAIVSIGPILGALLVLRYAPETKGLTLEEVQQLVGGETTLLESVAPPVVKSASGAE